MDAMSAIEALANTAIGFAVSWFAALWVLGYTPAQSVAVTAMFSVLSFARSFVLRIIFKRLA